MLTKPSPPISISASPSTGSVPLLTRSSLLSVGCDGKGACSSHTSKMRRRFDRATTKLHRVRLVETCEGVGKVDGVKLRLVANSTPLGGSISWYKACIVCSEMVRENSRTQQDTKEVLDALSILPTTQRQSQFGGKKLLVVHCLAAACKHSHSYAHLALQVSNGQLAEPLKTN